MVMLLPELGCVSGLRPQFYVYCPRARFVVELRAQFVSGSMRCECFRSKALDASEK